MKALIERLVKLLRLRPTLDSYARYRAAWRRLPDLHAAYLDHRRLALDSDWENLVRSVPVALRNMAREVAVGRQHADQAVDMLANSVTMQTSTLGTDLAGLRAQLEQVRNSTDYLLGRVEFIRRETMFELRYGASPPASDQDSVKAATEIISPEKLLAAKNDRLRLNLGCGHIPLDGYLNVDRRPLPGVDIVSEVDGLPFEAREVDEIFSAHLLEHFPQEQLRRELLPYWVRLLKQGGEFRAVVPDAESMIRGYADGSYPYENLREVTFGGQDYDGDFHFNMFVPDQIRTLLTEAGLSDIELLVQGRRNGACFEMEIRGFSR